MEARDKKASVTAFQEVQNDQLLSGLRVEVGPVGWDWRTEIMDYPHLTYYIFGRHEYFFTTMPLYLVFHEIGDPAELGASSTSSSRCAF